MHVITRRCLLDFARLHPPASEPLETWYRTVLKASYRTPAELKAVFATASVLHRDRVVFNIGGNKYRLVVDVRYEWQRVYIVHVLTHAEYDQLQL